MVGRLNAPYGRRRRGIYRPDPPAPEAVGRAGAAGTADTPEFDDLGRDAEQITLRGTIWIRSSADLAGLSGLMRDGGVTTEAEADPPQPLPVFLGGNNGASGDHIGNWVVSFGSPSARPGCASTVCRRGSTSRSC